MGVARCTVGRPTLGLRLAGGFVFLGLAVAADRDTSLLNTMLASLASKLYKSSPRQNFSNRRLCRTNSSLFQEASSITQAQHLTETFRQCVLQLYSLSSQVHQQSWFAFGGKRKSENRELLNVKDVVTKMGTAVVALDVEMGVTQLVPTPNPVAQYLELAMRGDLSAFQAEMGKHSLGITAGPDIYEDRSPLHMAALHGRLEIVKLIMASSEMSSHVVNARDRFGYTPLHLAVRSEHVDVVRVLTTSSLMRFVAASSSELDEEGQDCDGFTPLHLAAAKGNLAIVKLILQELACRERPVNIQVITWQGTTALDIAKQRKHVKLVDILECWDVNWLQLERQKSANSVNAILVGAALVATVTFGCLLQPPTVVSDADSSTFDRWMNRMATGWFLLSTSFSFAFSIISLVIGTAASIRSSFASLKSEVYQLRRSVLRASIFLFVAIFFLILASLQGTKEAYSNVVSGPTRGWAFTLALSLLPIVCLGFVLRHVVLPEGTAKKFLVGSFVIVALVFGIAIYCATGIGIFKN